jgi:OOP family OmpA-OmpF porin
MDIRSTTFRSTASIRALSAAFCSLLVVGSAAHAEGAYVLGSFGQSRFHDDISKSDKDALYTDLIEFAPDSSSQDEKDTAYKLQVGYQFSENFAVEGGYVDLGQQDYKAVYTDIAEGKIKTSAKGWNIDAVLILPVNAGVSLFAKVGVISAKVEQKISLSAFDETDSVTFDDTKVSPTFGIGVAYNFYQGWSARAELERFSKLGDEDETGESDVDLYSLGLSYQF